MGLLAKIFKPKTGSETETEIKTLKKWEHKHFPKTADSGRQQEGLPVDFSRYMIYQTDAGERIDLSRISLPLPGKPPAKGFLAKLKQLVEPQAQPVMLPVAIAQFRERIFAEIRRFRENAAKLAHLDSELRTDSFFQEIDRLFSARLRNLHRELLFLRVEELARYDYYFSAASMVGRMIAELNEINRNNESYMYALLRTEHEDSGQALEAIRIRVEALSEAVKETAEQN